MVNVQTRVDRTAYALPVPRMIKAKLFYFVVQLVLALELQQLALLELYGIAQTLPQPL
jgi:hypothetical protein